MRSTYVVVCQYRLVRHNWLMCILLLHDWIGRIRYGESSWLPLCFICSVVSVLQIRSRGVGHVPVRSGGFVPACMVSTPRRIKPRCACQPFHRMHDLGLNIPGLGLINTNTATFPATVIICIRQATSLVSGPASALRKSLSSKHRAARGLVNGRGPKGTGAASS